LLPPAIFSSTKADSPHRILAMIKSSMASRALAIQMGMSAISALSSARVLHVFVRALDVFSRFVSYFRQTGKST